MRISDKRIDNGKSFDFGLISENYTKYRDIYPQDFYDKIIARNLCVNGQTVLDLGTGTGVLPRNMYQYGAKWIGLDISENQIYEAKALSKMNGMEIEYITASAEQIDFPNKSFDVITACQCFGYFDHEKISIKLAKMLKDNGKLLILYMAWLPFEDKVAEKSEELVLKYNPNWTGLGETMHSICIPDCMYEYFDLSYHEEYKLNVPFTRESWNGRMKTCRGIGASLSAEEIKDWEKEHLLLLENIASEKFEILHYGALTELTLKKL